MIYIWLWVSKEKKLRFFVDIKHSENKLLIKIGE
jgi:hypothetical protein